MSLPIVNEMESDSFDPAFATPSSLRFQKPTATPHSKCTIISTRPSRSSIQQTRVSMTVSPPPTPPPRPPTSKALKFAKRVVKTLASTALISALVVPMPSHARDRKNVITMTDQVPNFTLPSQEEAVDRTSTAPQLLLRVMQSVKLIAPPLAILVVCVWAVRALLRKARERQLRDFQAQLNSFSSMLDLDSAATSPADPPASVTDSSARAKELLDGRRPRISRKTTEEDVSDLASKVRLDIFNSGLASAPATDDAQTRTELAKAVELVDFVEQDSQSELIVDTPLERSVVSALQRVVSKEENARKTGVDMLARAREDAKASESEMNAAVASVLCRSISLRLDRAAITNGVSELDAMARLKALGECVMGARVLGPSLQLRYVGKDLMDMAMREEVFRRYAVFCLSGERRMDEDLQSVEDVRKILNVSDERAEEINKDIAKGMFQVAVSAAMADGSLSDEDRSALDSVKDSFRNYLDGESADSIVSEVAVMRAMYSLQQLVQEQGVSADDVLQLRQMCKELGVDIDEMLQNADNLGDALGPDAKNFVDSLRAVLINSPAPAGEQDASSS